ncbi:MAG: Peptidylprolyl isomerase [Gammaproteobacteria bacterium]|jgi:peptidyl-prolyl cis-trans isomerase B (cyclophilin B)|nr:Peptidylprolyl isomerase [Gammaproteobacteria bacterium]
MIVLKTNLGDIVLALDAEKAPVTVANFLDYVNDGFYDNTIFHRVINGFMVQGGGFTPEMQQKPSKEAIENEAANGLKNVKGTIAMARTSNPHSASSQFFINVADNHFLDFKEASIEGWGYCVFGKVIKGMEILDKIKVVKTTHRAGHQDVPLENVIIEKAVLVED